MLKKITPILFITVIIGFVYGCGSSNPFIDEAESNLKSNNPQGVLNAAENSIEQHPADPLGYYYKAVALGDLAAEANADGRKDYYKRMNEAFEQAQTVADTSSAIDEGDMPQQLTRIGTVKTTIWTSEFNQGIQYATDDSLKQATSNPMDVAVSHLENATIIIPDSLRSWNALAQVAFMNNEHDLAIEAKENAIDLMESPAPSDYTTLAAYYATNKDIEGATKVLEMGAEKFPENRDINTRLADAYQQTGQTQKAISTVENLVEQEPDNPQFRLALGTQIYQTAIGLNDEIFANIDKLFDIEQKLEDVSGAEKEELQEQLDSLETKTDEMKRRYDELSNRAVNQLEIVIENRPNDAVASNTLGIIYQNKAAGMFKERMRIEDNQKAAEITKQANAILRKAMEYYEKAAEIDPENKDYWESLFGVYTTLGMDEKAEEAMKKAGIEE